MNNIMYVGLDVDDNAFHGCGIFEKDGNEQILEFKVKPNIGALMQKLGNFKKECFHLKVCYEATYLGYSLARDLEKRGVDCEVIAPSSIPRAADKTAKTDRIDSRDLARFYKNGLVKIVTIPDEAMEKTRDLIRSRQFIGQQIRDLKRHILSTCRRVGLNYREGSANNKASYFTDMHIRWLEAEANKQGNEHLKFNMRMLLGQMGQFENQLESYRIEIENIARSPEYKKKVQSLVCYRGIDILTAMVLILELGDIARFSHPRKLMSYAGMDLREYSSGGKERRYSMSKMGNAHIRTAVIESCQRTKITPYASQKLKKRRDGISIEFINIADRCMKRLYKKSNHMIHAGKPMNKIKVACAREMLCFMWESLRLASASA